MKCSDHGGLRKSPEAWAVGVPYFPPTVAPPGQILYLSSPWLEQTEVTYRALPALL